MAEKKVIRPQSGPQEKFLTTPADICIYGGAAGGGKTYGLLLEAVRNIAVPGFSAVVFRREYTQITSPGGLWDTSAGIYGRIKGAQPVKTPKLHWLFKSGATVNFAHLGADAGCDNWQGSQIAYIGFDELTHFTEYMFFYMLSRNRSTCGVKPYVRATCNPDCDSWVARFIEWWIDQDTGYPIKERSGKVRWMIRIGETIMWESTRHRAVQAAIDAGIGEREAETMPKSVTFIASTLQDNQILMTADPGYLANLQALSLVERERLLYGNWKIRPKAGLMFKRNEAKMLDVPPRRQDVFAYCRAWDLAATSEDEKGEPAYTSSVLMCRRIDGSYAVLHVTNSRLGSGDVLNLVLQIAKQDKAKYGYVRTRIPQDPGQAGKAQSLFYIKQMAGYDVVTRVESGDKITRAMPVSAQWQHGFVDVCTGLWNEQYFDEMESFPDSKYKDMVDATSSAFDELTNHMDFNLKHLAH